MHGEKAFPRAPIAKALVFAIALACAIHPEAMAQSRDLVSIVPYDGLTPDEHASLRGGHEGRIAVYGWSKDGVVLFETFQSYGESIFALDTVEDAILWRLDPDDPYDDAATIAAIGVAAAKYKIRPAPGDSGRFPIADTGLGRFDLRLDAIGETENGDSYSVVIERRIPKKQNAEKKIGTFEFIRGRADIGEAEYYYVKSPFEARALAIVAVPFMHPEFDYLLFSFETFGCHLKVGF